MTAFSKTPGANRGVIAESDGKLHVGWLDTAEIAAAVAASFDAAGTAAAAVAALIAGANTWAGQQTIGPGLRVTDEIDAIGANSVTYDISFGVGRLIAFGPDNSTAAPLDLVACSANASVYRVGLRLNADGSVRFGPADPGGTERVRVDGDARIGGALTVGGNIGFAGGLYAATNMSLYAAGTGNAAALISGGNAAVEAQVVAFGSTAGFNAGGVSLFASISGTATERLRLNSSGHLSVPGIPTSSAGLPAGTLWNDSGTLKVA